MAPVIIECTDPARDIVPFLAEHPFELVHVVFPTKLEAAVARRFFEKLKGTEIQAALRVLDAATYAKMANCPMENGKLRAADAAFFVDVDRPHRDHREDRPRASDIAACSALDLAPNVYWTVGKWDKACAKANPGVGVKVVGAKPCFMQHVSKARPNLWVQCFAGSIRDKERVAWHAASRTGAMRLRSAIVEEQLGTEDEVAIAGPGDETIPEHRHVIFIDGVVPHATFDAVVDTGDEAGPGSQKDGGGGAYDNDIGLSRGGVRTCQGTTMRRRASNCARGDGGLLARAYTESTASSAMSPRHRRFWDVCGVRVPWPCELLPGDGAPADAGTGIVHRPFLDRLTKAGLFDAADAVKSAAVPVLAVAMGNNVQVLLRHGDGTGRAIPYVQWDDLYGEFRAPDCQEGYYLLLQPGLADKPTPDHVDPGAYAVAVANARSLMAWLGGTWAEPDHEGARTLLWKAFGDACTLEYDGLDEKLNGLKPWGHGRVTFGGGYTIHKQQMVGGWLHLSNPDLGEVMGLLQFTTVDTDRRTGKRRTFKNASLIVLPPRAAEGYAEEADDILYKQRARGERHGTGGDERPTVARVGNV